MSIWQNYITSTGKLLYEADIDLTANEFIDRMLLASVVFGLAAGAVAWHFDTDYMLLAMDVAFILLPIVVFAVLVMRADQRAAKVDDMLPNFLSMMSSNIRSGVTYDRALLMSSRKEFGPLAKEIDRAAKQTVAGKPLPDALMDMAKRSRSETFAKTMRLIVEGVKAGGNLAELLEITAIDIRQSSSLKKEISATVSVYRLFIISASTIGAPVLYALTGFLIDVFRGINTSSATSSASTDVLAQMPLLSHGEAISSTLFGTYAMVAIAMTVFLSMVASSVITKGKESGAVSDFGWAIVLSYSIFFGVKFIFGFFLGSLMPSV